jgi:hypothetical protein
MVSIRLPVIGSTRRQYLVSGVPVGALIAACLVAAAGDMATIVLRAMTNALRGMSFLLECPSTNFSDSFDWMRGCFDKAVLVASARRQLA